MLITYENHIKIYQTLNNLYSKKDLKLIKQFFSSEKMRNSDDGIYDYAHSAVNIYIYILMIEPIITQYKNIFLLHVYDFKKID